VATDKNILPVIEGRRTFIGQCVGALTGIAIAGCAGSLLAGCEATTTAPPNNGNNGGMTGPITVDVSTLDVDGRALVTSQKGPDGKHVLIVRQSAAEYLALSMQCTHQQNEVAAPNNGVITCPFHGSQFDLTGAVRTGPATAPLKRYAVSFNESTKQLTVTLA
jgi:cytochrome b6-f complex iron-sulfur subunit